MNEGYRDKHGSILKTPDDACAEIWHVRELARSQDATTKQQGCYQGQKQVAGFRFPRETPNPALPGSVVSTEEQDVQVVYMHACMHDRLGVGNIPSLILSTG
jgi:hypothetical protein